MKNRRDFTREVLEILALLATILASVAVIARALS